MNILLKFKLFFKNKINKKKERQINKPSQIKHAIVKIIEKKIKSLIVIIFLEKILKTSKKDIKMKISFLPNTSTSAIG